MASGDEFDYEGDIRTRAAWLYYIEGLTQDAVAQMLGMTRARVLRMLAACREDGTVQIKVVSPLRRCVELERKIEVKFGIERVIVVPKPQDAGKVGDMIGAAVGAYLSETLTDGMTIGLGWGRTLNASLPHLPQHSFDRVTVVSLLGGLTRATLFNPSEFAWRFADRLGAECFMMAAPVYAPDPRTRAALVNHPGIEDIFKHAEKLDIALVSIGDISPNSTIARFSLLSKDEMVSLARAGAVGDFLCRFVDADGHVLDHPLNDCVISADPALVRSARKVILASGGWEKITAVLAGIRLLKPEVLITDEVVAESLVDA